MTIRIMPGGHTMIDGMHITNHGDTPLYIGQPEDYKIRHPRGGMTMTWQEFKDEIDTWLAEHRISYDIQIGYIDIAPSLNGLHIQITSKCEANSHDMIMSLTKE